MNKTNFHWFHFMAHAREWCLCMALYIFGSCKTFTNWMFLICRKHKIIYKVYKDSQIETKFNTITIEGERKNQNKKIRIIQICSYTCLCFQAKEKKNCIILWVTWVTNSLVYKQRIEGEKPQHLFAQICDSYIATRETDPLWQASYGEVCQAFFSRSGKLYKFYTSCNHVCAVRLSRANPANQLLQWSLSTYIDHCVSCRSGTRKFE